MTDAASLLSDLAAGRHDPRALMADTLDRIAGSDLNAVVSLRNRDDLLAEASHPRPGPLSGLPMAVKDLADTAGIRTTYGHPTFADHVPTADGPTAAALRGAGAILIGKTNTPEFGLGSHTFNSVHGTTLNPWDRTRSAGGSSGGAGAALAARLLHLADGSDMMGSLRNPAAWNNVFGLRPTHGLVPSAPVGDPVLHPLSTDGPMARTPDDLELLLRVLAPSYRADAPRAPRIGWLADWGGAYPMEEGVLALCEAALDGLADPVAPPMKASDLWTSWTILRSFAIWQKMKPLWTDAFAAASKPALHWEVERGRMLTLDDVTRASAIRATWARRFDAMEVDVIALPSAQCFAFDATLDWPDAIGGVPMDTYHRWMEVVVPASLIGVPAISVPVGFHHDLPMGVQLIARRGRDSDLIHLARRMHAARPWADRVPS
ncbi:amidase [Jannaschia donghaensis]|uniref:Glutamyl-tRNA(Gln) amidotransferase subunit A n=1 Tax=Jannaschia donghaensis TaxID=420998 RepID=A0A0M6YH99_9RHOB|nr:amidase [Jannaschia donghaensis]CTQ49294.1 Glutamyl-tRNA(Gln) amidotransferase subunit A [Jannaschia donghaensis]